MNYTNLFIEPMQEMLIRVFSFIPTLLIGLVILVIGGLITHLVTKMIHKLLTTIDLDKAIEKIGGTHILRTGGITHKPTELLTAFVYWVMMVSVIITTVKALGLTMASTLLDSVLAYIPSVISGVVVLIIGMLLAKVVSSLVYVVARAFNMPGSKAISRLTKFSILLYVTILFLKEIGLATVFTGPHFTILIGGFVFMLALAFGLAGKNVASKYLDYFKK